jgi:hypothetical protein
MYISSLFDVLAADEVFAAGGIKSLKEPIRNKL